MDRRPAATRDPAAEGGSVGHSRRYRPAHAAIHATPAAVPTCHTRTVAVVACAGRDRHAVTLLNPATASPATAPVASGVNGAPRRSMKAMAVAGTNAASILAATHGQSEY